MQQRFSSGTAAVQQRFSQLGGQYFAVKPEPDPGILEKIDTLDDFSQNRFRCITNPQQARYTLTPYSILELEIKSGRDLLEREFSLLRAHDITADAFVEVWLDDHKLDDSVTPTAYGKDNPVWDHPCKVEVHAPQSMLRLQVVDEVRGGTKADIGFVELAIGDIPFDTDIEGWFELRFQENMVRTSKDRYRKHCQHREEAITDQATKDVAEVKKMTEEMALKTAGQSVQLAKEEKLNPREKFATQKEHAVSPFSAFMQSTADTALELGLERIGQAFKGGATTKTRRNAGELCVRIKLRRVVSWSDAVFAHALPPEPPIESKGGFEETVVPDAVDFQLCCEEIVDLKAKLLDDAVFCVMYWLKYLTIWRSSILSFVHLVGFLTICWFNFTLWAILPLLAVVDLVVNYFASARLPMTRGGYNSPFTDAGFSWTAAWRNTAEMQKFLSRFVQFDMKCTADDPSLREFAALCFRDGVPTLNIEDLRVLLKSKEFVRPNEKQQKPLAAGETVWVEMVDGTERAQVVQTGPGQHTVTVQFEHFDDTGTAHDQRFHEMEKEKVSRRYADIGVPHLVIQTAFGRIIRQIFPPMMAVKEKLQPPVRALTDLLIWKNFRKTLVLLLALLFASVLFLTPAVLFLMGKIDDHPDFELLSAPTQKHKVPEAGQMDHVLKVMVLFIRHIDNVAIMFAAVIVWLTQSWWFYALGSVGRILASLGNTRPAPKSWAFFTPEHVQMNQRQS